MGQAHMLMVVVVVAVAGAEEAAAGGAVSISCRHFSAFYPSCTILATSHTLHPFLTMLSLPM